MGFAAHENDRDAFEMQPLNYEDLSEEAKQLIQQHVPGAGASNLDHSQQSSAAPSTEITLVKSPNQHLLNEKSNNNENNQQSTTVESSSSTSSPGEDEELARRRASEERKKLKTHFIHQIQIYFYVEQMPTIKSFTKHPMIFFMIWMVITLHRKTSSSWGFVVVVKIIPKSARTKIGQLVE